MFIWLGKTLPKRTLDPFPDVVFTFTLSQATQALLNEKVTNMLTDVVLTAVLLTTDVHISLFVLQILNNNTFSSYKSVSASPIVL